MTPPMTPEYRAQLIRQISQELNKGRNSSLFPDELSLNEDSTTSSFDPDREALMSTQHLDNTTQNLPEIRASAKKYGRYTRPEPDFVIDTSAIERAFPDFTQGGPSSPEDASVSIERGRAAREDGNQEDVKAGRSREFSLNAGLSFEQDSLDLSPAMIGKYQVMSTPPKLPSRKSKRVTPGAPTSLQQDPQVRQASASSKKVGREAEPVVKAADYGSADSRQGSTEHKRTLSAMHARVAEQDDNSTNSDGRPPTVNLTARRTRFSRSNMQGSVTKQRLPSNFSSTKGLMQSLTEENRPAQNSNAGTMLSTNPNTQRSFVLPEMPNLSELVSGVFQDGTPVFSRHGKSRASRFSSGVQHEWTGAPGSQHDQVSAIPIPYDEQAIFLSLKLLQDKVADLENIRAESETSIKELQSKNYILEQERLEQKRIRRNDSALGSTDGSDAGDAHRRGSRKWAIEQKRLESVVKDLHEQIDQTNRQSSVDKVTIRNLTQERDSILTQLGVAYLTVEQLKVDKENHVREIEHLKHTVARLPGEQDGEIEAKQRLPRHHDKERENGEGRPGTSQNVRGIQSHTAEPARATAKPRRENSSANNAYHDQGAGHGQNGSIPHEAKTQQQQDPNLAFQARYTQGKQNHTQRDSRQEKVIVESRKSINLQDDCSEADISDSSISDHEIEATQQVDSKLPKANKAELANPIGDLTFLSFMDGGEIAKLRKTLELERLARKQQASTKSLASKVEDDDSKLSESIPLPKSSHIARKSSTKDLTGRLSNGDHTLQSKQNENQNSVSRKASKNISLNHPITNDSQPSGGRRRHSENSILDQHIQHYGLEDMTSAFILPDITIRNPGEEAPPILPAAAQNAFDVSARHDRYNCTVCKRVVEQGAVHNHGTESAQEAVKIPRPIPVSERMPEAAPYEEEPTIRPSQPPPVALATVMKGLKDELAHLKQKVAQYQAVYNQHDPALSKRKRKAIAAKIQSLNDTMEVKADQIYALYDVLEGQKADGHDIAEEKVQPTLPTMGMDFSGLGLRGGDLLDGDLFLGGKNAEKIEQNIHTAHKNKSRRHAWDADGSSSEEDLPWDGINTTIDTTIHSQAQRGWSF